MRFDAGVNERWERPFAAHTALFEDEYAIILTHHTTSELRAGMRLWLWGKLAQWIRSKRDAART